MIRYLDKIKPYKITYLIFIQLIIIPNAYSHLLNFNNPYMLLSSNNLADLKFLSKKDFVSKPTLFKAYGPLLLDMNNIRYLDDIFFIPTINDQSKPFDIIYIIYVVY